MSSRKKSPSNPEPASDAGELELIAEAANSTNDAAAGALVEFETAPAVSLARTEQEQRGALVRDINTRIAGLESRIDTMAQSVESSRQDVGAAFATLEAQVRQADELLLRQQRQVDSLSAAQGELRTLHEQLDRVRRQQGAAIDALTQDTRRRFEETRDSLVALHELCYQQRDALLLQRRDHETVARDVNRLHDRLRSLDGDVAAHRAETGVRFRVGARAIAAVAALVVLALGLITWYQINPTAVPESVSTHLAALDAGLAEQQITDAAMLADLQRQGSQIAALGESDRRLARDTAALHASDTRLGAEIGTLRSGQSQLKDDVALLREEHAATTTQLPTLAQ